jgi:adenosine deaminase CECR1
MSLHHKLVEADRQDKAAANLIVRAQYDDLAQRASENASDSDFEPLDPGSVGSQDFHGADLVKHMDAHREQYEKDYMEKRARFSQQAKELDFDARCRAQATEKERQADKILNALRRQDQKDVYFAAQPRLGHAEQEHRRVPGDHFLSNVGLINQTALLRVAREFPKGAHLHNHFNASLPPKFLLEIAAAEERMFINSDLPLLPDNNFANLDRCAIQFSIRPEGDETNGSDSGDLFSRDYVPKQFMKFSEFLQQTKECFNGLEPMEWLEKKLVFHEDETHGLLQTAAG